MPVILQLQLLLVRQFWRENQRVVGMMRLRLLVDIPDQCPLLLLMSWSPFQFGCFVQYDNYYRGVYHCQVISEYILKPNLGKEIVILGSPDP